MSERHSNLIRKQYMVSEKNIEKLIRISAERGISAAEIVRRAIDAYDATDIGCHDSAELMGLVTQRIKEAIKATKKTNRQVSQALTILDRGEESGGDSKPWTS
jgi:hypothetical protein